MKDTEPDSPLLGHPGWSMIYEQCTTRPDDFCMAFCADWGDVVT